MSRQLLTEYLTLDIADLKRAGLLRPAWHLPRRITWHRDGANLGNVAAKTIFNTPVPVLQIVYNYKRLTKSVFIPLRLRRSNLGRGYWYGFACPKTGRTCRKLYLNGGAWVSRAAVGAPYACQAHRKEPRRPTVTITKIPNAFF